MFRNNLLIQVSDIVWYLFRLDEFPSSKKDGIPGKESEVDKNKKINLKKGSEVLSQNASAICSELQFPF